MRLLRRLPLPLSLNPLTARGQFYQNQRSLQLIECLKVSGMPIKEIKQFLDLSQEGDASLKNGGICFMCALEL